VEVLQDVDHKSSLIAFFRWKSLFE
jgi:hypothetical protein